MEAEGRSRTELALPTPREPASASEIELAEVSLQESVLMEKPAPTAPRQTWLTVLKRELEFLGVTQILIGLIYLYFGIIVSSEINDSEFTENFFSSFKAGYPFWGALFFVISGILSIMSEKKPSVYLIRGCLGANAVSSVAAGTGVGILISNLKQSSTYVYRCKEVYENDYCSLACFSTEVVAIILLLTILGFGSAVSLMVYGIGEIIEGNQIPEDRLYEEVNIYSPIYSELEEREETASPADSILLIFTSFWGFHAAPQPSTPQRFLIEERLTNYVNFGVFILPSNPHTVETASPAPLTRGLMPPTEQQESVPENLSPW